MLSKVFVRWSCLRLGFVCAGALLGACDNAGESVPGGSAGASPAAAGQATAGNAPGAAGAAGQPGAGGASNALGGTAGQAGGPLTGGGSGTAGASGAAGSGNVGSGKGASGQAVCAGLSGFVDPTTGIGNVKEVTAPQGSFFAFIEGPVWVATTKQLLFSDNAGSPERIWSFDPMSMMLTKALEGSGSNGLA
ncbi:MAG TPA: hypothetical protein VHP33_17680, partial [Polyangiaceae bacterium]|nr:hypothetical protein [Polyangiaceae bacterium]